MCKTQTTVDLLQTGRIFSAPHFIRLLLLAILVITISGCDLFGGDGGSDDDVIPPVEPPGMSPGEDAVSVNGKKWLQPSDFTGYVFDQVNAVCPGPAGVCSGSLQGSTFDLTGYTWASIMEVSSLFNAYGVSPTFTEPFQERFGNEQLDVAIALDFAATDTACYGDCPVGNIYVSGMARDTAQGGGIYIPYFHYIDETFPPRPSELYFNNTNFASFGEHPDKDDFGVWFWRLAALDAVTVDGREWLQPADFVGYSYVQLSAVCPAGRCLGTLPGSSVDLTGYTWASSDDVSLLFGEYEDAGKALLGDFQRTATDLGSDLIFALLNEPPIDGVELYVAFVGGNRNDLTDEQHGIITLHRSNSASHNDGAWFWRTIE